MGQYYVPIILDDDDKIVAWMSAHEYGNGLKLMGHSWLGNNFVAAFETMLTGEGGNRRVVWAGDYANHEPGKDANLYMLADEGELEPVCFAGLLEELYPGFELPEPNRPAPTQVVTTQSHPFLINHDRKEFVDKTKVPEGQYGAIHPLPLLTVEGNGRGGGDFWGADHGLVGRWARDHITVSATAPGEDFTEVKFDLTEG